MPKMDGLKKNEVEATPKAPARVSLPVPMPEKRMPETDDGIIVDLRRDDHTPSGEGV